MDSESLSFQEDGDRSGDIIMSENDIDPNYEPSEEEILKYAIYLGMNPEEDRKFLYIAREGLKAPVPKPWKACQTKSGEIYYFNFESGESMWDHPSDDIFRKKFQQTKALSQHQEHDKHEPKVLKQLQKKQQGSKSVQLIPTQIGDIMKKDFTYSHRENRENDRLFSSSQRYSKDKFFYSGQLSINQEDSEKEDSGVQIHESRDQSFEHIEDYGEQDNEPKSITDEKQIDQDSQMPETKNFYDDVSLDHDNSVNMEESNKNQTSRLHSERNIEDSIKQETKDQRSDNANTSRPNDKQWESHLSTDKENENMEEGERGGSIFYDESQPNEIHESHENIDINLNTEEEEIMNLKQSLNWVPNKNFNKNEQHMRPERENGGQSQFRRRNEESASKKANEEESVCFSDFKFADTEKKDRNKTNGAVIKELENEFQELLMKYEEELGSKFSEILAEYEQDYQNEAADICKEYEEQVIQIRKDIEHMPLQDRTNTMDTDRSRMRSSLLEKNDKELNEERQKLIEGFEDKRMEIEMQEEVEIKSQLKMLQKSKENDFDKTKQELQNSIEDNRKLLQKLSPKSSRGGSQKITKGLLESNKKEALNRIEGQFKELEKEENSKLQRELEGLRKELDKKIEYEKTVSIENYLNNNHVKRLEEAFKLSIEEFKLLKSHIEETYRKNLEQEKDKLLKRQEKVIKELEKEELSRAEEIAAQKAMAKCKPEHDKKMNNLQVEKMLYEKQSKKRLEEVQTQSLKKYELDKVSFENQKNSEMKRMSHEINTLLNQILNKDGHLSSVEKYAKDVENAEKEIVEKNNAMSHLNADIADLEAKSKETKAQITEVQIKLRDTQQRFAAKSNTLNELHQQLDKVEQEINANKEKLALQQRATFDYGASNDTFITHTSTSNLYRLLREVEGIKSAVKKRSAKKSSSVSRTSVRNVYDLNNRTIDASKGFSIISNDKGPGYLEEGSKILLEDIIDREPLVEKSRILRKSQEVPKKNDIINSSYYSMAEKKHKEPYIVPSPFNALEAFQKPKTDWKLVIETEKKTLAKYGNYINQKKAEARETHKQLKKEGEQYKIEHNSLKNAANSSSTKKLQLEIFKKSLNDKIYDYNQKLCQIRDKEGTLRVKDEALNKIEKAYEDSCMGLHVSQEELSLLLAHFNDLYNEYKKINLKDSPEPKKQTAKSVERVSALKDKITPNIIANIQPEGGRVNLNIAEILKRNRENAEKNQAQGKDESSKENDQAKANILDAKLVDKVKNSVFQRKVLRKPSPSSILSLKSYFDTSNSKLGQDYSSISKK